jgi:hypothetical protein
MPEAPGKRVIREKPDHNTRSLAALMGKSLTEILSPTCFRNAGGYLKELREKDKTI